MMVRRVIFIFALALVVATQSPGLAQQVPKEQALSPVFSVAKFPALLSKARSEGYQVDVAEESKLVKVKLQKEGKTQEGHGFLNVKWDQRESWELILFREGDKLRLFSTDGTREKKPPVAGTWSKTKLVGLPTPFLVDR